MNNEKINNGGPAFPFKEVHEGGFHEPKNYSGMTLRDYFAAMALQGIIISEQYEKADDPMSKELLCFEALEYADEMLKAREK
jgi:hypothetical protein